METNPKITVLMPMYNSELYIREAVDSILNQTFTDFEFIIIDDASTDKSVEIVQSYTDSRINLIVKPKNSGYTNSLNYGLSIAKGAYIARMDSDDISVSTRFEKQFQFLEKHNDVVVCGSQYKIIDTEIVKRQPLNHEEIKIQLLDSCCIAHPTVMMRKSFLWNNKLNYDTTKEPAEDYNLWSRIIFIGKIANLNEILLYYRRYEQQTSSIRYKDQLKISLKIRLEMYKKLSNSITEEHLLAKTNKIKLQTLLKNCHLLTNTLKKENDIKNIYDKIYFNIWLKEQEKVLMLNFFNNGIYSFKSIFILLFKKPIFFKTIGFIGFLKFIKRVLKNNKKKSNDS